MAGYDLRIALGSLSEQPRNFVLYRGADADQILITANPANASQKATVEAECGPCQRVLGGVCFREGSALVFAIRMPAAPAWEKMIAKVMEDRKCGQYLPITLRQLDPSEPEEVAGAEPASGVAAFIPQSDEEAEVYARWQRLKASLMPELRTAIMAPATREETKRIVTAALVAERATSFGEAIVILENFAATHGIALPEVAPLESPAALPAEPASAEDPFAELDALAGTEPSPQPASGAEPPDAEAS